MSQQQFHHYNELNIMFTGRLGDWAYVHLRETGHMSITIASKIIYLKTNMSMHPATACMCQSLHRFSLLSFAEAE